MANELAIRVKVILDTSKSALDQQFSKIKDQYNKTPVEIAFSADINKTRSNLETALDSLIKGTKGADGALSGGLKIPEITLKFKVNNKELSTQIQAAIKAADTAVQTSAQKQAKSTVDSAFSALRKKRRQSGSLEALQARANSSDTILISGLQEEIDKINKEYDELRGKLTEGWDTKQLDALVKKEEELNKEIERSIRLATLRADQRDFNTDLKDEEKDIAGVFKSLEEYQKRIGSFRVSLARTDPSKASSTPELSKLIEDEQSKYESLKSTLTQGWNTNQLAEVTKREKELNDEIERSIRLAESRRNDTAAAAGQSAASRQWRADSSTTLLKERMEDYRREVANLSAMYSNVNPSKFNALVDEFDKIDKSTLDTVEKQEKLRAVLSRVTHEMDNVRKYGQEARRSVADATGLSNLQSQIQDILNQNPRIQDNLDMYSRLTSLLDQVKSGTISLSDAKQSLATYRAEIKELGLESETTFGRMARLFNEHIKTAIAMAAIHAIQQGLQVVYQNVVNIDTAMTELRKVTDETERSYSNFLDSAAVKSRELGTSISDYISSTAEWAQSGYSFEDADRLAYIATMYKNVGDGIESAADASEYLISALKGFNLPVEEAEHILDVINKVSNEQPIAAKDIGEILTRSSAAMAAAGNSLEEVVALGTAAFSVTRDAESVGSGLRTVSMRIRGATTELEAAGEDIDGMASSVSELRQELLALTGGRVDVMIDDTTFKSTYQILEELAGVWDSLTDIGQANILELIAGKNRGQQIAAILTGWDTAASSLESAFNATGSAAQENERYLDSIAGRMAQMDSAFESLSVTLLNSDLIKFFASFATGIIDSSNAVLKLTGVLPALVTVLTSLASIKMTSDVTKFMDGSLGGVVNAAPKMSALPSLLQGYVGSVSTKPLISSKKDLDAFITSVSSFSTETKAAALNLVDFDKNATYYGVSLEQLAANALDVDTEIKKATKSQIAWNSVMSIGKQLAVGLAAGLATWGIQALIGVVQDIIVTLDEANEKMVDSIKAFSDTSAELTSLRSQLTETDSQIAKIQSKGTLTIADKEQIKTLEQQNESLRMQTLLLEQQEEMQRKQAERDISDAYVANARTSINSDVLIGATTQAWLGNTEASASPYNYLDYYNEYVQLMEQAAARGDAEAYARFEKEADRYKQLLLDYSQALLEYKKAYDDIGYDNLTQESRENYDSIVDTVSYILAFIDKAAGFELNFNLSEFSNARRELEEMARESDLTAEVLAEMLSGDNLSPAISGFVSHMESLGYTTSDIAAQIISSMDNVGASAENMASSLFGTLEEQNEALDAAQEAYQTVRGAIDEYNEAGQLSADTLQALAALSPEYTAALFDENGQLVINEGTLGNVKSAYIDLTGAIYEKIKAVQLEQALDKLRGITNIQQARDMISKAKAIQADAVEQTNAAESLWAQAYQEAYQRVITADGFDGNVTALRRYSDQLWDTYSAQASLVDAMAKSTKENIDYAPGYSNATSKSASASKEAKDAIDELSDSMGNLQSAYKTIQSAITEYNENGYLTVDTLDALMKLDSKYLDLLYMEDGQLKLNAEGFQALTRAHLDTAGAVGVNSNLLGLFADSADEASRSGAGLRNVLEDINAELDEQSGKVDDVQDMYSTLRDVFEEYNKYGSLDVDSTQDLMGLSKKVGIDLVAEDGSLSVESISEIEDAIKDKLLAALEGMRDATREGTADYIALDGIIKDIESDSGSLIDKIMGMGTALEELNEDVDNMQSGWDTLKEAVKEYNTHGFMSIDMLQSLSSLEPEYLSCLEVKNGLLTINVEKYKEVAAAQMMAQAAEYRLLATQSDSIDSISAYNRVADLYVRTAEAISNSTWDANNAISGFGSTVDELSSLLSGLADIASFIFDLFSSKLEATKSDLEIYGEAIDEELANRIAALEAEQEAIEAERDAQEEANDELERAIELQKLKDALEQAKNTKVRRYIEGQGYQWVTDENAVKEAQDNLDAFYREQDGDALDKETQSKVDAIQEQIDALEELRDKYGEAADAIGEDYEDFVKKQEYAAELQGKTFEELQDNLENYKNAVISNMREIGRLEGYEETINNIINGIQNVIKAIQWLKDAFNVLSNIFNFGSSGGGLSGVVNAAGEAADKIDNKYNGSGGLWDKIKQGANNVKEKVITTFNNIKTSVTNVGTKIKEFFVGSGSGESATGGIWSAIKNGASWLKDKLVGDNSIFASISNGIKGFFSGIGDGDGLFSKISSAASALWDNLTGGASNGGGIFSLISNSIRAIFSKIGDGDGLFSGILKAAGNLFSNLLGKGGGLFSKIVSGIASLFTGGSGGSGVFSGLVSTAKTALSWLGSLFTGALTGSGGILSTISGFLGSAGTLITHGLGAAGSAITAALSSTGPIGLAVAAGAALLGFSFTDIGSDLIGSLVDGLADAASKLWDFLRELGDGVADFLGGIVSGARGILSGLWDAGSRFVSGVVEFGGEVLSWLNPFNWWASGTTSSPQSGIAGVDEEGQELIVRNPKSGRFTYLETGDGVVPADITSRLFEMGGNPNAWFDKQLARHGNLPTGTVSKSQVISIGDVIVQHPIGDTDALSKAIVRELPNRISQDLSER